MNNRPTLPQIIFGFIALYKKHRTETNSVLLDTTQYVLEYGLSLFTKTKPVDDQINQILSEIELQAQTASEFDDFYALIIKLREKGELAQTLKWKNEESKLHGMLHALASIIINEYRETEIFKEKVEFLISEEKRLTNLIDTLSTDKNGIGVKEARESRQNYILQLAYLEQPAYIIQALDNKTLKSLEEPTLEKLSTTKFKQPVNFAWPIHLQPNYADGFYGSTYQTYINVGFDEFINKNCIKIIVPKVEKTKTNTNSHQIIEEKLAQQKKQQELLDQQKKEKELLEEQKKQQELLEEQKKQQELLQHQQQPSQPNTGLSTQAIQQQLPQLHLTTTTTQDAALVTPVENNEIKQSSTENNIINYPEKGTSSNTGMYSNSKSTPVLPAHTNNNNNNNNNQNRTKTKK